MKYFRESLAIILLNLLVHYIGSAKVDAKTSRFKTPSRTTMPNPSPSTDVSNESTRIASPEKVAPTQPTPAQPRSKESLEDFKTTQQNGHGKHFFSTHNFSNILTFGAAKYQT